MWTGGGGGGGNAAITFYDAIRLGESGRCERDKNKTTFLIKFTFLEDPEGRGGEFPPNANSKTAINPNYKKKFADATQTVVKKNKIGGVSHLH